MKQWKRILLPLLGSLALSGCGGAGTPALTSLPLLQPAADGREITAEALPPETEEETICVYLCGSVKTPGIYYLPADTRLAEAVEAAGGFQAEANPEACNLARRLADGEQVLIPSRQEGEGRPAAGDALVNLNTADLEELMTLSGIGAVRAEAIIRSREEEGFFRSVEEITRVSGIGKAAFEKIKDHIRI